MSFTQFWDIVTAPRTLAAYALSFGAALIASLINVFFGFLIAWVLARYSFPGKKIVDAFIDFPFALPTAVAGIALTTIYSSNGLIGQFLYKIGIQSAYSWIGIVLALIFIGLPFIVRTIEPVLQEIDPEIEEAASSLGAGRLQIFLRIIFPAVLPSVVTGFGLALARTIGEYGSVVFIAGNMPGKTEIAPLLIITKLEQFDYSGATAIALVMLIVSFILLALTNLAQWWASKRIGLN